ncbi:MAG: hypothetical protein RIQ56_979, partial [Candidatus Parcubacteria bacterium]|jgi:D-alanyl-D-alanine carboxypeptidase/LAS superfamily LD-carboxypeptidase LdcB
MKDFLDSNKDLVIGGSALALLIGSSLFAATILPRIAFDHTNQLAQILTVETKLLKEWQQSAGLRSTLALNSSGREVSLLQRMLSQDPLIYPEKKVTGYYGDITEEAVSKFQEAYALPQTGIVDEETRIKLNEIFLEFLCPEQEVMYPDLFLQKVERERKLPSDYVPPSLQDITHTVPTVGIACARKDVVNPLIEMFRAAEKDGVRLAVTSGYRKPEIQQYLYDFWLQIHGPDARDMIAEPGASEHQLGTTFDLTDESIGYAGVDPRFARSEGGRWLAKHAHTYGFVMSYPRGKEKVTGYAYEPWHWRFVGVEIATKVFSEKTTFNESAFAQDTKPFPKVSAHEALPLSAYAVTSVFISPEGFEEVLVEKNKDQRLPIASVTKLMVALIASDTLGANDAVVVSQNALKQKGISGYYRTGDSLSLNDALHALLIGSHNEIALSIAEQVGTPEFVGRMNDKARILGLTDTHFVNVTGLDPGTASEEMNYSTASDIAMLLKYIFENKPDLFSILEKRDHSVTLNQGARKISIETTNELIKNRNSALRVLGGKTGETPKAKMNLAIVSETPTRGHIVSVVLASDESFADMRKLLQYLQDSFVW